MIIKKIYLTNMRKLFLFFFLLMLHQKIYASEKRVFDFGYANKDKKVHLRNSSSMINKVSSDFDYSSFNTGDEPSDLDILMSLGDEVNNLKTEDKMNKNYDQTINSSSNFMNNTDLINKNNNEQNDMTLRDQSNEFGKTDDDKLKIENEVKVDLDKDTKTTNFDDRLDLNNLKIDSNIKKINQETEQNKIQLNQNLESVDLLDKKVELPQINIPKLNGDKNTQSDVLTNNNKINKTESMNQVSEIKNNPEDIKKNDENLNNLNLNSNISQIDNDNLQNKEKKEIPIIDQKDLVLDDESVKINIPNIESKDEINNLDNLNNLNINITSKPNIQDQNVDKKNEKKDEEKSLSIKDKIKSLLEKKDEKTNFTEGIELNSEIKNNEIKVIDNTNNNSDKIIKTSSDKTKNSVNKNLKKPHIKKELKKKKINYSDDCDDLELLNYEKEKEIFDEKYDSKYENKIYEYSDRKNNALKKLKLSNYKIKVNIPEFLKVSENTLGNGHLNQIYYYEDYVNSLFAAVLDENLPAIDSLLRIIKNADIKNSMGETLLTYGAKNQKTKSIRYLLKRGCNTKISNNQGETLETIIKKNNHTEILSMLKQS